MGDVIKAIETYQVIPGDFCMLINMTFYLSFLFYITDDYNESSQSKYFIKIS